MFPVSNCLPYTILRVLTSTTLLLRCGGKKCPQCSRHRSSKALFFGKQHSVLLSSPSSGRLKILKNLAPISGAPLHLLLLSISSTNTSWPRSWIPPGPNPRRHLFLWVLGLYRFLSFLKDPQFLTRQYPCSLCWAQAYLACIHRAFLHAGDETCHRLGDPHSVGAFCLPPELWKFAFHS